MSLVALTMGFAACDQVEESLSTPQTNPQETIFDAQDLTVTAATGLINLQSLNNEDKPAAVANYDVKDFPQSSVLKFVMEMSTTEDFAKIAEVPAAVDDEGNVVIEPDELQAVYYSKISRNPIAQQVYVRFRAYAANGSEEVRIGNQDAYYGEGTFDLKPFDPENVIEEAYYFIGGSNGTLATAVKMEHSDVNQYDDPNFTLTVDVQQVPYEWFIVPASTYEGGEAVSFAPDSEEREGMLEAYEGADFKTGKLAEAGPFEFSINMMDKTYNFAYHIEELYTPGNSNGGSCDPMQYLANHYYYTYNGFAYLDGAYRFTSNPDGTGANFGQGADAQSLSDSPKAPDFNAEKAGLYWCSVNVPDMTCTVVPVKSIGLIGDFNDWGSQADLTPSADFMVWSGSVEMAEGQTFKIRGNDDWGINLGGEFDALKYDGANLESPGTGTYTVTLDLSAQPYTLMLVKQ